MYNTVHACEGYKLVRERSALADPYCHLAWNSVCGFVGSRALSFSGPLLSLSVEFCVCVCVCLSATLRSNISETKGARRKVTIGSL